MKRLIDFSSRFRILKGGKISLVVSALLGTTTLTFAAPSGGVVTSGSANISQVGNTTNITQNTGKVSINWNKFNIASNETVNFKQPNVNSIALNRVIGNEKSIINGALNANGQVWILNSNGVLFGKNAKINTAGLLATTKNLSDEDFNAGNYNFKGSSTESVINLGEIDISDSGYATLLANTVSNEGTIKAVKGSVRLIGANEVSINLNGNSIVDLTVDKGVLDSLVENKGAVYADGGEIYLTTNAVDELLKGVVNNTGIIEANSLDGITGHVELFAHGGEAKIGGTITAKDGFVETSGKDFTFNDAKIKAGEWLIDPVNVTIDDSLAGAIESQLGTGDVTIETDTPDYSDVDTSNNESGNEGNIYVNSEITWSTAQKLTLDAYNDIFINKSITATNAAGQLALHYGDSADYYINAQVNLSAGDNFFTKQTSDGSETVWTVVTTANDLQSIALGGNSVLGADVDASGIANWDPIGDGTTRFTGNFDGLGHTVDNLTINRPTEDYIGLFGYTGDGVTIKNIGTTGTITGQNDVGGLIGKAYTNNIIYNSFSSVDVQAGKYAGGLVGRSNGTISNSYATGDVNAQQLAGGFIGLNYSDIYSSYATGDVTTAAGANGNGQSAGGFAGALFFGTIKNSYTTSSNVSGTSYVGGLIGSNNGGTIENSYTTSSNVSGTSNIGGLIGSNSNITVIHSYFNKEANTGAMHDSGTYGKTREVIATLVTDGTWDANVWNPNEETPGGGDTVEGYEYALLGLPYLTKVTRSEDIDTVHDISKTLFESGFGTEVNPYTITNWKQLQNINYNTETISNDYHFNLMNDLGTGTAGYDSFASTTANGGLGWNPLALTSNFEGVFDGMDHTIDSLTMNRTFANPNHVGLFGTIWGESVIKNIHLTNLDISTQNFVGGLVGHVNSQNAIIENASVSGKIVENSTENYIATGGLVGVNYGTILNSHAKVDIEGTNDLGGLVGSNGGLGAIKNSYSDSVVKGKNSSSAGGLVGMNNQGVIENSYALGKVTGTSSTLGGIVGLNLDTIKNSYFDGVIEVNNETITKNMRIGGVTGLNYGTIENSYASGEIDATINANGNAVNIGGVAGLNNKTIENSYTSTKVTASVDVSYGGSENIAGVAGINNGTINNSYYDKTINTEMSDEAEYGKTTAQLQDINTFKNENSDWNIVEDSTLEKGTPILSWQIGKDGESKPIWLIAKKIEEKPEVPTSEPEKKPEVEKEIDKVVTTIVNKEAVKVPNIPKVTTTPNNAGKNVNVAFSIGENKQIVSKPIEGQTTKRVTLSEAKQMQQETTGQTVGDVKVPLSRSSQIVLVNGGVSLPNGVEQEFYVADDEI